MKSIVNYFTRFAALTVAILFVSSAVFADGETTEVYLTGSTKERWESGLIHQFAKLAYSIRVPGVRIPLSPQHKNHPQRSLRVLFCPEL
jgi:hypothetical protein